MITDKFAQKEYVLDLCDSVMSLIVRRTKSVNYPNEDFKNVQKIRNNIFETDYKNITDEMFISTRNHLRKISEKYPM